MCRVNAYKRGMEGMPASVKPYCTYNDRDGIFVLPTLQKLMNYRVVVSTCMTRACSTLWACPTRTSLTFSLTRRTCD